MNGSTPRVPLGDPGRALASSSVDVLLSTELMAIALQMVSIVLRFEAI